MNASRSGGAARAKRKCQIGKRSAGGVCATSLDWRAKRECRRRQQKKRDGHRHIVALCASEGRHLARTQNLLNRHSRRQHLSPRR